GGLKSVSDRVSSASDEDFLNEGTEKEARFFDFNFLGLMPSSELAWLNLGGARMNCGIAECLDELQSVLLR
ncbi:unnamed protein product, partial [Allacma fusca]